MRFININELSDMYFIYFFLDEDDNREIKVNEIEEKIESTTISDDGIFKVTLGPTPSVSNNDPTTPNEAVKLFRPSPRINSGLAVKHGVLYLYGGMFEDGDKQITFSDLYSLDLKKLDEWKPIITDDTNTMEWLGSDSEDMDESDGEEESADDESDDSEMETD